MNERIRELADKIWAEEYWDNPTTDKLLPAQLNRFAELIVRECVRYLNEDYQRDFDTLWREDLSKGIREHFGVQ
jgi:hypothetical protein